VAATVEERAQRSGRMYSAREVLSRLLGGKSLRQHVHPGIEAMPQGPRLRVQRRRDLLGLSAGSIAEEHDEAHHGGRRMELAHVSVIAHHRRAALDQRQRPR
jgi:hypothetical protein